MPPPLKLKVTDSPTLIVTVFCEKVRLPFGATVTVCDVACAPDAASSNTTAATSIEQKSFMNRSPRNGFDSALRQGGVAGMVVERHARRHSARAGRGVSWPR